MYSSLYACCDFVASWLCNSKQLCQGKKVMNLLALGNWTTQCVLFSHWETWLFSLRDLALPLSWYKLLLWTLTVCQNHIKKAQCLLFPIALSVGIAVWKRSLLIHAWNMLVIQSTQRKKLPGVVLHSIHYSEIIWLDNIENIRCEHDISVPPKRYPRFEVIDLKSQ